MYKLNIKATSQVAGGFRETHFFDRSVLGLYPDECYSSNILGASLCHNGIYDLSGNLIQAIESGSYCINGYEVQMNPYEFSTYFTVLPNIYSM